MLKDCLNTLLHELPEEPLPFIQQYFNAKGPAEEEPEAADAGGVAGGDEALMRAELNSAGGLGLGAVGYDSSDVSETDTSEEEDEMCAPPPRRCAAALDKPCLADRPPGCPYCCYQPRL